MTRQVARVILPACLVAGLAGVRPPPAAAQEPGAPSGVVEGTVASAETGLPVAGAEILARGASGAVTDSTGRFRLGDLAPGTTRFDLRLPGLPARTLQLEVEPGAVTRVELRVATRLVPVPSLEVEVGRASVVSGKMAGFYSRRARGIGAFLDRDDILLRQPREVSDLLRSVPGITVDRGPGSTGDPRVDRSAALSAHRRCRMSYFVDGLRIPPENAFRLDELSPRDLQAVEVYRGISEVPAVFVRTGEECGVVAVWTRDPSRP